MEGITYNKANQNDIQKLVDYRIEFMVEFWDKQSKESIEELKRHLFIYFTKAVADNSCIFYFAKSGDKIVGVGGMIFREQPGNFRNPSGKVGYLVNMYTIPSFRRKGICTEILERLINEGKQSGLTAFELHATKDGEAVYKNNGFHLHGEPTYRRYIFK